MLRSNAAVAELGSDGLGAVWTDVVKGGAHGYQWLSGFNLMADFVVFAADGQAGRAIPVTADTAEQARAKVLMEYPGAETSVVPAGELEGCNRTMLLWEWMGMATRHTALKPGDLSK